MNSAELSKSPAPKEGGEQVFSWLFFFGDIIKEHEIAQILSPVFREAPARIAHLGLPTPGVAIAELSPERPMQPAQPQL